MSLHAKAGAGRAHLVGDHRQRRLSAPPLFARSATDGKLGLDRRQPGNPKFWHQPPDPCS